MSQHQNASTTGAKHTHYLLIGAVAAAEDIPACVLALNSGGRWPLFAGRCQDERNVLAEILGGGALAELLRGGQPITVERCDWGYVIREA